MNYYHRCPACRAYLDPGEKCDCQKVDFSELFAFDSVTAVVHPQVNNGKPVPNICMGYIEDPELRAWFNRNFISVGEWARRQEESAPAVTAAETQHEPKPINNTTIICDGTANVKEVDA